MEKMQMWFKEFFPLNYRAICHPDTSLPSNTWICVSYKHGHTQHSWDAAIQSQTLLPCKLQTPFSFYHSPNGALDCEGSSSEQALCLAVHPPVWPVPQPSLNWLDLDTVEVTGQLVYKCPSFGVWFAVTSWLDSGSAFLGSIPEMALFLLVCPLRCT